MRVASAHHGSLLRSRERRSVRGSHAPSRLRYCERRSHLRAMVCRAKGGVLPRIQAATGCVKAFIFRCRRKHSGGWRVMRCPGRTARRASCLPPLYHHGYRTPCTQQKNWRMPHHRACCVRHRVLVLSLFNFGSSCVGGSLTVLVPGLNIGSLAAGRDICGAFACILRTLAVAFLLTV